jgi:hypothetical protein
MEFMVIKICTAKAVGSAWFCVGLCLATQKHYFILNNLICFSRYIEHLRKVLRVIIQKNGDCSDH